MIKQFSIFIFIIAIAIVGWLLIPDHVWRYIFFLRAPIICGLLLVLLPVIATNLFPAILRNLFVLRGLNQLTFVIVSANMAAIGVVFNASMILSNSPDRFELLPRLEIPGIWRYVGVIALSLPTYITSYQLTSYQFSKEEINKDQLKQPVILGALLSLVMLFGVIQTKKWLYFGVIALSLPICITSYQLSKEEITKDQLKQPVILGALLSLVVLFAVIQTKKWIFNNFADNQLLINFVKFITKNETNGYINTATQQFREGHLGNITFFLVALIVYGFIGLIFKPQPNPQQKEAAALVYLMLIIMMIAPLTGNLTFYFDYYRFPVFLPFVFIVALTYWLFGVDHFFDLNKLKEEEKKPSSTDCEDAIKTRLKYQGNEKTLVVVCASGGGIQAAGWTVKVMTGLQEELGESFTKAVGFISSVSGGSVGTMYYLDRFDSKGYPKCDDFNNIFNSATQDSLDAVGWGLAYPDLWRIMGLPFLASKMCDRGTALETDWQGELKKTEKKQSLATWREQILKGEIPIPIFNATLVEDGRRFLMSPITFGESNGNKSVDFNTLYSGCNPGYNIDIVTAARLSASFSYVSPIARNPVIQGQTLNYHIADGGYFDNSGVVTMVEWLNEWLDNNKELNIKRVLLLQINAFPEAIPKEEIKGDGGWWQAIIGPFLALFSVRDSTQLSRTSTEVELHKQKFHNVVDIEHFSISFPSAAEFKSYYNSSKCPSLFTKNGEYNPPLSWKLTKKEKDAIKTGWEIVKRNKINDLKKIWIGWGFKVPNTDT